MTKKILLTIFVMFSLAGFAQYEWSNVNMGGGGFVSAVITSKTEQNIIYARTDVGGAYRWDETNSEWIPLLDWVSQDELGYMGVEAIALDPQQSNMVYMLAGTSYFNDGKTAILKSDDYGESFEIIEVTSQFWAHGNGYGRQNGERLAVDPNNSNVLFCGTRAKGLFKSTDAGETWSQVSAFPVTTTNNSNGICSIVFDGSDVSGGTTQTIYAAVSRSGNSNVYVSTDGGSSWSAVSGQSTTYMPHRMTLASDGDLYITYADGAGPGDISSGQIMKYASGSWTNVTPSGYSNAFGGISVDPDNSERLVATTTNAYKQQTWDWGDCIFISTNGGSSWTELMTQQPTMSDGGHSWIQDHAIHWAGSIEFDPFNTDRVFVTSGNGIFVNEAIGTNGSTWTFTVDGFEETVPNDLISIPGGKVVSAIYDYDGCAWDDITEASTRLSPYMGYSSCVDYAAQNTSYVVRAGSNDNGGPLQYSTDGGDSWNLFSNSSSYYNGGVCITADASAVIWSSEGSSNILRTTNWGSSWSTVSGVYIADGYPVADPVNSNYVYIYNENSGAFYVSSDGGASFSQTTSLSANYNYNKIRVAPDNEGDIWLPNADYGLYRSTNHGSSFSKVSSVSSCYSVGFGISEDGTSYPSIYIWGSMDGTNFGIYQSDDEGSTWTQINDDNHEYGGVANGKFVIGDMNMYGRVYMSTAGRGIVVGTPNGSVCYTPDLGDDFEIATSTTSATLSTGISDTEYSYQWTLDGETLSSTTTSIDISAPGTYTVIASKSGCSDKTDEIVVSVECSTPDLGDDIELTTVTETTTLDAGITGEDYSYSWTKDGTDLGESTVSITAEGIGTYIINVTKDGCDDTADTIILAVACTDPELGEDIELCETTTATLESGLIDAYTFSWTLDGETLSSTTSSITVSKGGTYILSATKTGCDDTGDTITVISGLVEIEDDTVCINGIASLEIAETGTYAWYDAEDAETALYEGNPFETDPLTETTTYWVEDIGAATYTLGLTDFNSDDENAWEVWSDYGNDMYRMILEVSNTVTFDSVAVYSTWDGTDVVVRVLDADSNLVATGSSADVETGIQYVAINTTLDAGTYTIDAVGTSGGIYIQLDGADATMEIDGYVSLTHLAGYDWHGPFYDYHFSVGNSCARRPVTVVVDETCTDPILQTQTLTLESGWNFISINTVADDMSIGTILPNATIVKTANTYYLSTQDATFNTLTELVGGSAYLVYNSADDDVIEITGEAVDEATYSFKEGWNFLGYPLTSENLISTDLSSITDYISIIKNFEGIWEPESTTNTYDYFVEGVGYFIYVTQDCTITW